MQKRHKVAPEPYFNSPKEKAMAKTFPDRQFGVKGLEVTLVIRPNITTLPGEVIISAIDSDGNDADFTGRQIRRSAGVVFHEALRDSGAFDIPRPHGFVHLADKEYRNDLVFGHCLFVVDERARDPRTAITNALSFADSRGFKSVIMPAFRMNAETDSDTRSISESSNATVGGIVSFAKNNQKKHERSPSY